jgi:hypothetical protein
MLIEGLTLDPATRGIGFDIGLTGAGLSPPLPISTEPIGIPAEEPRPGDAIDRPTTTRWRRLNWCRMSPVSACCRATAFPSSIRHRHRSWRCLTFQWMNSPGPHTPRRFQRELDRGRPTAVPWRPWDLPLAGQARAQS